MIDYPHDPIAEQAVLGVLLTAPRTLLDQDLPISGGEFYQPKHETIWLAIKHLADQQTVPDPTAVLARLMDVDQLAKIGGGAYLMELVERAPVVDQLDFHLDRLRDRAGKRRLIDAAQRITQEAQSGDPLEDVLRRAETRISETPSSVAGLDSVMTLSEFLAQPVPADDWIIPGLLDRGDRLILTGSEGLGKSVLMRQVGMCVAGGMDPFYGKAIPAKTVLIVDCENPLKIMIKVFSDLQRCVRGHVGHDIPDEKLWIDRKPAGINLADPADRLWLKRLTVMVRPDLLCIGPTYKLYVGEGSHEEYAARVVASTIDEIREEIGCAVVMEHHMPHGTQNGDRSTRPIGSSMWMRWPEFGVGLRLAKQDDAKKRRLVELEHWRGARDERDWPEYLESGGVTMPWVEAQP